MKKKKTNLKFNHVLTLEDWSVYRDCLETFMEDFGLSLACLARGFNLTPNHTNRLGKLLCRRSKHLRHMDEKLENLTNKILKGRPALAAKVLENFNM